MLRRIPVKKIFKVTLAVIDILFYILVYATFTIFLWLGLFDYYHDDYVGAVVHIIMSLPFIILAMFSYTTSKAKMIYDRLGTILFVVHKKK
jgi:hypothetical protein